MLTALLDTRFRVLVTPIVVRWIYLGCMTITGAWAVFWILFAWWVTTLRNGWAWGVIGLIAAPVTGLVLILVTRVACEFVIVRFIRR